MHTPNTDRDALLAQLATANRKEFCRPAVPAVYHEYELFMETGRYPYLDDVIATIAEKYGLPNPGQHSVLGHEVYLASGEYRVKEMADRERLLAEQGYKPITDLVLTEGVCIELSDGVTYRLVHTPRHDWCLLPPRKRSRGLSLRALTAQHHAYLLAREEGQTRPNSPCVHMYR
jgi:hypothetical protein